MRARSPRKAGLGRNAVRVAAGLAVLAGLSSPAWAVIQGQVSRDPNGTRSFVVRVESTDGEICSGTLIARDLVLTAAHCVMRPAGYRVISVDRSFLPSQDFIDAKILLTPANFSSSTVSSHSLSAAFLPSSVYMIAGNLRVKPSALSL